MDKLRIEFMKKFADMMEEPFRSVLPDCKTDIPEHLIGRVAEFRQYSLYELPMAVIKKAIAAGDFLKNVDYPTPPMVLVVDEAYNLNLY